MLIRSFLWLMRVTLGILFLALGVVGLLLPIMPGWVFVALGILALSPDVPFFQRMVHWIENRFPPLRKPLEKMRSFMSRYGSS
ncbi:MAG: hypothetical protein HGA84_05125 [Syntrophobacteraceae bacterium]|jgi:uncharacterized membrane protein YbaN (DUF454 family)|nr:hypothetical protein [Syntrophobacteraceae bacterium]